jgi:uncharacterized protein
MNPVTSQTPEITTGPVARRIAIAGASGFMGAALREHLEANGHTVIGIGRAARGRRVDVEWDPEAGRLDRDALRGVDAVVNLTGETIGQRWTDESRRRIVESRLQTTTLLAQTCALLEPRPRALLNVSAVGYYGNRGDEELDENSAQGTGFLADLAGRWEGALAPAQEAGLRVVVPRLGLVLHPSGGLLDRLLPVFRLGAGGVLGSGEQWMSWIGRTDALRALDWLIADPSLSGPVNLTAPAPVRNREFTRVLARMLRRPAIATVPAFAIRLMFGQMGEETVLGGQRVVPRRLLATGFDFRHPELEAALAHELNAS